MSDYPPYDPHVPPPGGWGQQYPGQYGQPQYGQPQYGGPYGAPLGPYGPPPPKRSRTAIVIAAVLVVLVVGGGVIAGVVLSGGDDTTSAVRIPTTAADPADVPGSASGPAQSSSPDFPSDPSTSVTGGDDDTVGATAKGIEYFTALEAHSLAALHAVACSDTHITLTQEEIDTIDSAMPDGEATVSGTTATIDGTISQSGETHDVTAYLRDDSGSWCVSDTKVS